MQAERFFVESTWFHEHLHTKRPTTVHMFMKMHPSHSVRMLQGSLFQTSQTIPSNAELIIDMFQTHLKPRNITLTIHVSSLYKTFIPSSQTNPSKQGIEGLHMLLRAGIRVECFEQQHWLQLANLCTKPILLQHLLSKPRLRMDDFVRNFLKPLALRE